MDLIASLYHVVQTGKGELFYADGEVTVTSRDAIRALNSLRVPFLAVLRNNSPKGALADERDSCRSLKAISIDDSLRTGGAPPTGYPQELRDKLHQAKTFLSKMKRRLATLTREEA